MSHFDPGPDVARARAEAVTSPDSAPLRIRGAAVTVGTASWTDPTLTARGVFYPDDVKTPDGRLRFYASRFPMVEVDSSYYALPTAANAERWVERTPAHFTFDVKAFALMTGHPTETERLPRHLREALPEPLKQSTRLYAKDLPPEFVDAVWATFRDAIEPLRASGKLGGVFLQYAPWVMPNKASPRMLEHARDRLGDVPIAVEFRNARWLTPRLRERTWELLRRLEMAYTVVDEPQGMRTSVPADVAVTSSRLAVLRLHGKRADLWEKRGVPVVEKYRYLYTESELDEWRPSIVELAEQVERLHIVFNNCYANYGTTNAAEMAALLRRMGQ
jgi:uncharacterized protein YecE (DUF72 family)